MEMQSATGGRVLIVDDTPENIEILGYLLKHYKRIIAVNGQQALKKARQKPPPDLILLDIMMPEMDGFEVCRRLKSDPLTESIPVIFVTALGETPDETKGLELGAVDYITKPFKPAVIKARVATHMALQHARHEMSRQNQTLEERVKERTAQLKTALEKVHQASLETILRLSRAAEYRDDDTGAHLMRMSRFTATVARQLALSDAECHSLLQASPLHDIGKIGVPDRILLKPGKLDKEEWDIMRRHCEMGADILSGSDAEVLVLGEIIAMTHHEKWNGSGYPKGLNGEEIPIAGRITAIADVFDALTSKRPYKQPFSIEKACAIIKEGRGTHFDPDVVDAFFASIEEILEIKNRYQDDDIAHLFAVAIKSQ
jgi:putative two-component system response regulator